MIIDGGDSSILLMTFVERKIPHRQQYLPLHLYINTEPERIIYAMKKAEYLLTLLIYCLLCSIFNVRVIKN